MNARETAIVRLLEKQPLKPGELSRQVGISRQALHRYLQVLLEEKRIQKHGAGPHVTYSATPASVDTTRVRIDYEFCRDQLLPRYISEFGDGFSRTVAHTAAEHPSNARGTMLNFAFLLDTAAVYSSNIEGNTLDLNSFLNSRMSPAKHRPKEAREIEDLVAAYDYARTHDLEERSVLRAHGILSRTFVARSRQGRYRAEPIGVFSRQGLEYMAVEPPCVQGEMRAVFSVTSELRQQALSVPECFFWATWLHLMIALIHPFSDGNGRTARLCEKWFLASTIGERAFTLPHEEIYWKNRPRYYAALKLGASYWEADMNKAFPFFALLPQNIPNIG